MIKSKEEIKEDFAEYLSMEKRLAVNVDNYAEDRPIDDSLYCFECGRSVVSFPREKRAQTNEESDSDELIEYIWVFCEDHYPDWDELTVPPENSIILTNKDG